MLNTAHVALILFQIQVEVRELCNFYLGKNKYIGKVIWLFSCLQICVDTQTDFRYLSHVLQFLLKDVDSKSTLCVYIHEHAILKVSVTGGAMIYSLSVPFLCIVNVTFRGI